MTDFFFLEYTGSERVIHVIIMWWGILSVLRCRVMVALCRVVFIFLFLYVMSCNFGVKSMPK